MTKKESATVNVPKFVKEVFYGNFREDSFYDLERGFYIDDIWESIVLDCSDEDFDLLELFEKDKLVNSFYCRATKYDWEEMREKYDDKYNDRRNIACEQLSNYYDELFKRECKKRKLNI